MFIYDRDINFSRDSNSNFNKTPDTGKNIR